MKNTVKILIILSISFGCISCNRIKTNTERIAEKVKDKTKQEIKEQANKAIEKVFPSFDSDQPDTDNNKKRFKDFLKVELTEDIKNIYCFDDAIGIDASYIFSFNCDSLTSKKIISTHNLIKDENDESPRIGFNYNFEWWDQEKILKLDTYCWNDNGRYYKYFWYDKENKNAYYLEFDM